MKTIWKYPLKTVDSQALAMPEGAQILTVQTQRYEPCLWALVSSESQLETRVIEIFGTGHSMPTDMSRRQYIGTYQLNGGALVFHVFEAR